MNRVFTEGRVVEVRGINAFWVLGTRPEIMLNDCLVEGGIL